MTERARTLVLVEDRETIRVVVEETLRRRGWTVRACGTLAEGRALLADHAPGILLTDLQLPDGSGLDLLTAALACDARMPVVVMSAYGTIGTAVEAMKRGAYDFVTKPFDTNQLVELLTHAIERRPRAADAAAKRAAETDDAGGILGESPAIQSVIREARQVAASDATVLVLGESGTGKELIARAIHRWSGRAQGPLVSVNCAAIPRELVEGEFFGSERGSFTGAVARKLGKVELAKGGTLFLDEIAELPGELQAKFLRVLQERTFARVGGTEELHADIRVIAATNKDPAVLVREGRFREDLYYRLNVFPIRLPSLRERPEDVVPLAREFAWRAAKRLGKSTARLSPEAEALLARAPWPGNVRQLENAIERAVILSSGEAILPEHLTGAVGAAGAGSGAGEAFAALLEPVPAGATLLDVGKRAARRAEEEAIRRALAATQGNKTQAAQQLGVSYKTLWSKLKEYELE
jgi:DNA-binding NtrC family response regulator